MASTPSAMSGAFSYDARVGLSVNDIPRCEKLRLRELLAAVDPGPALTKKGKARVRQPARPQDESVEFYRAQMVHYGLAPATVPSTVTREAAKIALRASALQVPKAVQNVEAELKRLHEAKKNKQRVTNQSTPAATLDPSKKRQRDAAEPAGLTSDPKRSKTAQPEPSASAPGPVNLDAISGSYSIVATVPDPGSEEGPFEEGHTFNLVLSPKRSHVWGRFDFGPIHGCLRSTKVLNRQDGIISFHWCGIDEGAEEPSFGADNVATVQFLADGKIKGRLDGGPCEDSEIGPIDFTGTRVTTAPLEDVVSLKAEYWALYMESFDPEAAGSSRWGRPFGQLRSWDLNSDSEDSSASADVGDIDDYDGFSRRCAFDDYYDRY